MSIKNVVFGVVVSVGLSCGVANANWVFQEQGGAFSDDSLKLAVTVSQTGLALGVRCTNSDKLELAFITEEKIKAKTADTLNLLAPLLRLRVDSNDIIDFDVVLSEADGILMGIATAQPNLLSEIKKAKRKISVVLSIAGEQYHETVFSVRGSTKAMQKLESKCGF